MLTPEDDRVVLEAADRLAAATSHDALPNLLIDALALAVDADFYSYNDVDLVSGEARFVLRPGRTAPGTTPLLRRFGYHPAAIGALGIRDLDDGAVPRFVRDPKLRSLGLGNCCGEAEIRLNAGLSLATNANRLVGIGIGRSLRDFDDRDREVLLAIHPHFTAAFRRALAPARPEPDRYAQKAARLTRRENEVLYWVAMGKTNDEIGTIIGASPLTVKKHLEHVYEKLEVPNRTAAARMSREAAAARGLGQLRLAPSA